MTIATIMVAGLSLATAQTEQAPTKDRTVVSQPAGAGQTDAPDQKRYCVVSKITGTILARKECHSRAEWQRLGIDPTAKR